MALALPRSAACLSHIAALAGSAVNADAVGVHAPEIDHRRRVAGLGRLRQQPHRLERVLVDDLAVEQQVGQPVHGLDVIFRGRRPQQAQAFLPIHGDAASVHERAAERGHGVDVAGVRTPAVPAHRLRLVAGDAQAGGIHPAQAVHDMGIAAVGQPAQRRHVRPGIVADAPDIERGLAARRHRREALEKLLRAGDGTRVQADDDIAQAGSRSAPRDCRPWHPGPERRRHWRDRALGLAAARGAPC